MVVDFHFQDPVFLDNLGEGRMDPRVFKKLRFSKAKFYPMSYDFR
jgi:hypothetical protein